jgi:hypothetical protein
MENAGGDVGAGPFFVFLKSVETAIGPLLIADLFTPLVLLMLFPVTINVLLFHIFLGESAPFLRIAVALFALNVYLIWANRTFYLPLVRSNRKPASGNNID